MDNCKDLASGTRYNLIVHKIKLYRAFLAMDYNSLREEELKVGFLLAQDDDLRAIFEAEVNRELNASSRSLFIPNPGEPVSKERKCFHCGIVLPDPPPGPPDIPPDVCSHPECRREWLKLPGHRIVG